MITVAVVTENIPSNIDLINKIRNYYSAVDDFMILSDDGCQIAMGLNYSLLSPYYIRFLKGVVVFLDKAQYLSYKDRLIGYPILYTNHSEIENIDRSLIGDIDLLTIDPSDKPLLIRGSNV